MKHLERAYYERQISRAKTTGRSLFLIGAVVGMTWGYFLGSKAKAADLLDVEVAASREQIADYCAFISPPETKAKMEELAERYSEELAKQGIMAGMEPHEVEEVRIAQLPKTVDMFQGLTLKQQDALCNLMENKQ